jgi:hypothetical protein
MVSRLFFYQLALIALVWLCILLLYAWPMRPPRPGSRLARARPSPCCAVCRGAPGPALSLGQAT